MAILGVLALLVFGEKKLPGVMRQAGRVMREVQNTSQSFLREMDRAADVSEPVPPFDSPSAAPEPELPFESVEAIEPPIEPKPDAET